MKTRSWRGALPIGGLLAFLALVAVAAAGHAPSRERAGPARLPRRLLQDYIATLSILIMPVGAVLILWAMLMKNVYKDVPLKSKEVPLHGVPRPFIQVAIIIALIVIALRFGPFIDRSKLAGGRQATERRARRRPPGQLSTSRSSSGCRCSWSARSSSASAARWS